MIGCATVTRKIKGAQASSFAVSTGENRAHTRRMGHDIAATSSVWKEKRRALRSKRDSLFEEYAKRPQDCHLALEIKTIDDEIAECNQKEQEGNERAKVRRQATLVSS
jgi:hypothetical protein